MTLDQLTLALDLSMACQVHVHAGDQEMTLDLSLTCQVHAGDQETTLDLSLTCTWLQEMTLDLSLTCQVHVHAGDQEMTLDQLTLAKNDPRSVHGMSGTCTCWGSRNDPRSVPDMPGPCWGSRNDPRSVPDMYLAGDQEMTLDLSLTCPDMYMLGIKK